MRRIAVTCLLALAANGCGSDAPETRPPELRASPTTFDVAPDFRLNDSSIADPVAAATDLSVAEPVAPATDSAVTAPTDIGRCDPNYTPCVPVDSDVDCAGGRGNGPSYVRGPVKVVGTDVYGLDRDGDGTGCDR
jgi:hypothetical protein